MDLSILIPSRNEEFLNRTVEDLIEHIEGNTEVIVVLDGWFTDVVKDPRVRVIHNEESIGQRAAMNQAARTSTARYIMKVDAHCAFDQGFDVKMMSVMEDDITMVPVMRNLHVFDWVCNTCGMRVYQGPDPEKCRNETCNFNEHGGGVESNFKKDMIWNPKTNPQSSAYRFNKNLQFKYFPELRKKQDKKGLVETMSLQGSCFLCTREKYWEIELCDESWGSWGQQGTEVALKTWLSGGRVLCNRDTWYAHLFRTQPGFSHPYPGVGKSQQRARKISRDVFLNNKWKKQVHPLHWLLDKFWFALKDVRDEEARWENEDLAEMGSSKGIIYYTDNSLDESILNACQSQISRVGLPIVSSSLKKINFGKNIVFPSLKKGHLAMFTQILGALENSTAKYIFFCEHDCLYHASHFDFTPPKDDTFYYNTNVWKVRYEDGHALRADDWKQTSGLCANRKLLIEEYKRRVDLVKEVGYKRGMGFEPGTHEKTAEAWASEFPNIDIRHDKNLTPNRWRKDQFRNKIYTEGWTEAIEVPDWGNTAELMHSIGHEK